MKELKSTGIIIIGGHVMALGIARSLGKLGIPVYLVYDKSLCVTRFSRYVKKFIKAPKGTTSYLIDHEKEDEFLKFFMNLEDNLTGHILVPTNDAVVHILSKHKKTLERRYKVSVPELNIVNFAYNKRLTYAIAKENNIPVPYTIYPENLKEMSELSPDISFPVIIKGTIGHRFFKKIGVAAIKANSQRELIQAYIKCSSIIDPQEIMIQEVIPGSSNQVYSFCSFFRDKKLIGLWTGRKIREHPSSFGVATVAESIYIPELVELGLALLKAMDYYGISEIEFKKDPRDGKFKLIEMNPRIWLWVSLATYSGVNLPYLLYKDIIGERIQPINGFKEDVVWIHFWPDLAMALKGIVSGNLSFNEYFSTLKGEKEFCVISRDDPLPFIAETLLLPYLWFTR